MLWTLLTAFVFAGVRGATAATNAGPTSCVSFDINWNLLAFGFSGKDYNVGTQDTWTSSSGMYDGYIFCVSFIQVLTAHSPDRNYDAGTAVSPVLSATSQRRSLITRLCRPFNSPNARCFLSEVSYST